MLYLRKPRIEGRCAGVQRTIMPLGALLFRPLEGLVRFELRRGRKLGGRAMRFHTLSIVSNPCVPPSWIVKQPRSRERAENGRPTPHKTQREDRPASAYILDYLCVFIHPPIYYRW